MRSIPLLDGVEFCIKFSIFIENITEYVIMHRIHIASPDFPAWHFCSFSFSPWCLASLYIPFCLVSCFSMLLQITLCEREPTVSCSICMHTTSSCSQGLYWLGHSQMQGRHLWDLLVIPYFSYSVLLCCISSFFSYALCRWNWNSEKILQFALYTWQHVGSFLWFSEYLSQFFLQIRKKENALE